MTNAIAPVVRVQMMIRRPVADVFRALVDPVVTTRFWFSKSSGPLKAGTTVRWDWEMYGAFTHARVHDVQDPVRILIEWDVPDHPTFVEWTFEPRGADQTLVVVRNWGFGGDSETVVAAALDSTGGFSFLVASMKAFLEHGIELRLVADHAPDALVPEWNGR